MVDLVQFVEIKSLIDLVSARADELSPNERELFQTLVSRYEEPVDGTFDDRTCLEVMLRNMELRKGYGMKGREATRRVDLPRKPDGGG